MALVCLILAHKHFSHHLALRDIKETVRVESAALVATFPDHDAAPATALTKIADAAVERFPERILGPPLGVAVGERAKIVPIVVEYFSPKALATEPGCLPLLLDCLVCLGADLLPLQGRNVVIITLQAFISGFFGKGRPMAPQLLLVRLTDQLLHGRGGVHLAWLPHP